MESTRKKSCTACRHAKARCNLISPTCSRCARRNLSCIYPPGHTRQGSAIASPSQKSLAAWPSDDGNQVDTLGSGDSSAMACGNGSLLSDSARWNEQMTDNEFEEMLRGCGMLNWTNNLRFPSEQGEISSLLEEQSGVESASGMSGLSYLYDWSTPNTQVVPEQDPVKAKRDQDVARALQQSSNFQLVGWRVLRGISDAHPNILSRKMAGSVEEVMGGNYVWSCLSEYPTQFRKETLPPFIHRSTMRKDTEDLPETLANCELIVKMYEGKTNGTRYLVHKTLMQEVQRLRDEFSGYDGQNLILGLQAMTIYLIMIAADEARCHLISIMVRICMGEMASILRQKGYISSSESQSFPNWKEWVLEESRRRVLILLHLVDTLVDMNIGGALPQCGKGPWYLDIPLPSSNVMWEAETEVAWSREYQNYLSRRKKNRPMELRDLVTARKSEMSGLDGGLVDDLSDWSKEVDSFGSILLVGGVFG